jgi:hypothetical protein
MSTLGAVICQAIVHHYGRDEFLRRLSHPFWFQSFGAVMGMDWHSSGITTSVIGALKRGLAPLQGELGFYVCGGRGKHSRKTPGELAALGDRIGIDAPALTRASRLEGPVQLRRGAALSHRWRAPIVKYFATSISLKSSAADIGIIEASTTPARCGHAAHRPLPLRQPGEPGEARRDHRWASQMRAVLSAEAVTIWCPSGVQATPKIAPVCPVSAKSSAPVMTSHTRAVPSNKPVTIRLPSGDITPLHNEPTLSCFSSPPLSASKIRIVPLDEPVTMRSPRLLTETLITDSVSPLC